MSEAWPPPPTWLTDSITFPPFNPWQNRMESPSNLQGFNAEEIREWIRGACADLGVSPTQLARSANLAASTVNRFLRSQGQANLGATTIEALRQVIMAALSVKRHREGAEQELRGDLFGEMRSVNLCATVGLDSRTNCEAAACFQVTKNLMVPVPSILGTKPVHGFQVLGDGMKDLYPSGSVVLGVPYTSLERAPESGEHVIVYFRTPDSAARSPIASLAMAFTSDPQGDLWLLSRGTAQSRHLGKTIPSTEEMYISHLVVAHYCFEPVLRH